MSLKYVTLFFGDLKISIKYYSGFQKHIIIPFNRTMPINFFSLSEHKTVMTDKIMSDSYLRFIFYIKPISH